VVTSRQFLKRYLLVFALVGMQDSPKDDSLLMMEEEEIMAVVTL
jgi:hypothetical protein